MSSRLPRFSSKAGLTAFLSAGFFLALFARYNYLLVHTLIELCGIVLLMAVFLIGWKTRHLVRNQFFVIMAIGSLSAGMVDLLHTLLYKGLPLLPSGSADTAAQLWLIARILAAGAFLAAALSLGRRNFCSDKSWLLGFLLCGALMITLVWPLGIFPACLIDGRGPTPFRVNATYLIITSLALAASLLWLGRRHLGRHLLLVLQFAIALGVLSELTLLQDGEVYGITNFIGHYLKFGGVLLIYYALVEGSLRSPFEGLFIDMAKSCEDLNLELQKRVIAEKQQKLIHSELTLLYRLSRAMHKTLNLDELAHLILSAATGVDAGGFERAMLFTVNQRTGMLQGMLGISQETASIILPDEEDPASGDKRSFSEQSREDLRRTPLNQKVIKQRLSLNRDDNALARAFLGRQVIVVAQPDKEPPEGLLLAEALALGPYACAPLIGRDQIMGVLLVDNSLSRRQIPDERKQFLELFANQAGLALDNAGLVKRLEMAHGNLHEIQEQLIHGEKMAVLGEMAAQVAHELRNPLVSIGGFAQRLARQELEDPKANEYAGIIAREVRRMEEMLGNILAFSKKQLICLDECHIGNILQEVFDLEYEHCQRQNIELVCELQEDLPWIVGDYRQLRQVFLNVVINARQVMSAGGLLTVRARSGALHGDQAVRVEVEDTGGGISPEVIRNIFNPFFSTFAKGTGLGLSISHRIIAQHHGEIEVVNAELGARFIISLPLIQPGPVKFERKNPDLSSGEGNKS